MSARRRGLARRWRRTRAAAVRHLLGFADTVHVFQIAFHPLLQEYVDVLKEEGAYKAVEKNLSGSRPRELFDDVIEDAEKEFEKDRSLLKVCSRRFFFQMEEKPRRGVCTQLLTLRGAFLLKGRILLSIAELLIHDECPRRRVTDI